MGFRRFSLINSMFVLLLVVGMNHCIFESLFCSSSSEQAASQAADPRSDDCQSHPKGDPASHAEGQACVSNVVNVSFQTQLVPADILNNFRNLISTSLVSLDANQFQSIDFHQDYVKDTVLDPLVSLSISSNAPPALA